MTKIVIADDDPIVRHILSAILGDSYQLTLCETGEECVSHFQTSSADLLFLDIQLPDLSGPEVLAQVRGLSPEVKIVAISANPEEEMREIFGENAPDFFLEKPFTPDRVLALL
jgi:CheY-like chemotaxis protein